jgi:glucokinase
VTVTLGLDVGGTKVAAGLVDVTGEVLHRACAPTGVHGARDPGFAVSLPLARRLLDLAARQGIVVHGVGLGVPEYVSPDGRVTSAEVLGWDAQPGPAFAALGLPVTVGSDVRCGALAEARYGAGRGAGSLLYVSAGTGLSSALVLDGVPWPGRRGEAIALGELAVSPAVAPGETGSVEAFAAGAGILRRYRAAGGADLDGPGIDRAATDGDPLAGRVVDSSARATAHALHAAVALLDPERVVLGGGLGTSRGRWAQVLRECYADLTSRRPGAPALVRSALGADAGIVGAALAGTVTVPRTGTARPREQVAIRRARPEEAGAMREVARAAYTPYVSRIGREPAPMTADYDAAVDAGHAWVADLGGWVVGILVAIPQPDHLLVENVAVLPDRQGTGLGGRLLQLAEELGRTAALPELRLYTNEAMTENLDYYLRRGYRETGRAVEHGYRRVHFRKDLPPA